MKVIILAADGCLASAVVGLRDIFWLAEQAMGASALYTSLNVMTLSINGEAVTDGHGRLVAVDGAYADAGKCDAIIVPGFIPDGKHGPPPAVLLQKTAGWLRDQHAHGALICGSCSGVFLIGEAGLLDGRRSTTTWWLNDELNKRYPRSDIAWGATLIEDRRVLTAGGPLSWINLALAIVGKLCGPEAARRAADVAVVDTAPPTQSVYAPVGHLTGLDPFLAQAAHIVRASAQTRLTARDLAAKMSTSERTLHRKIHQLCGQSPKAFIDRIRFDAARTALETRAISLKQVAARVGFTDETSFRRSFQRHAGMAPGAYRAWAKARSADLRS